MGWHGRREDRVGNRVDPFRLIPSARHVLRFWHTVRHLRPVQIHGRLWFRFHRPAPDTRPAPALRTVDTGKWVAPARRPASMVAPDAFRFLNVTHRLSDVGWDNPTVAKLWRYNLHYFDDLNALGSPDRADWHRPLLETWIAENPPATGTGWEPYPTSLRVVNWIKWALAGETLSDAVVESLAVQTRWLARRLEVHLLGNHLFANAKALVFAGLFFQGDEADDWLDSGLRILAREIPEQILDDGGHFERSTMYHAIALEDLLDLVNVTSAFAGPTSSVPDHVRADWFARVDPMQRWLQVMSHPDGEISFFNDAAFGIAPALEELANYAERLGTTKSQDNMSLIHLKESGYIRIQEGPVVTFLDVAPVGPDYLPGHAHADTLSFELSFEGRRLLVNSGTSTYERGAERQRQRGTASHNTVVINGENSSDVWSSFRVGRRARPGQLSVAQSGSIVVSCEHDGYAHLDGSPVHRRCWRFDQDQFAVCDTISGEMGSAIARFHFHPDVLVWLDRDGRSGAARLSNGKTVRWRIDRGLGTLEHSTFHPEFGTSLDSTCLVVTLEDGKSAVSFFWP